MRTSGLTRHTSLEATGRERATLFSRYMRWRCGVIVVVVLVMMMVMLVVMVRLVGVLVVLVMVVLVILELAVFLVMCRDCHCQQESREEGQEKCAGELHGEVDVGKEKREKRRRR
jgi:Flp pilus assembly protein TadB